MRTIVGYLTLAALPLTLGRAEAAAGQAEPAAAPPASLTWAYPVNPPRAGGGGGGGGGGADANTVQATLTVPGSGRSFTMDQIRNGFDIADWRPDLHPAMPAVVSSGRSPDLRACGFCHYPTGHGRPENASLAGQPVVYVVQQMMDFKNDLRVSSEPGMGPPRAMVTVAKAATPEEAATAAEYFASFPYRSWVRVVETNTVPTTVVAGSMRVPAPEGGTEPIGERIIEVPEDPARTGLRDAGSGFVAYVPTGSVARGRELVTTGGGKSIRCAICHGEDLRGAGPMPALAGRSPSYSARQLYDFRSGARRGAWSELMRSVVANLTPRDILDIVAYTASLQP